MLNSEENHIELTFVLSIIKKKRIRYKCTLVIDQTATMGFFSKSEPAAEALPVSIISWNCLRNRPYILPIARNAVCAAGSQNSVNSIHRR